MKTTTQNTTLGLAAAICLAGSSNAAIVFSSDFNGSATDITDSAIPTGNTAVAASVLNGGTSVGSWVTDPSTSGAVDSTVSVSSDASITGSNWMLVGDNVNDLSHTTLATMDLASDIGFTGTTITMDIHRFNAGGGDGGLTITGYASDGTTALFSVIAGAGGNYGQKDLSTASAVMHPGGGNLRDNTHDDAFADNTLTTITLTLSDFATGYVATADGGTTDLAGSYFANGDIAFIALQAEGSKARFGIDNISVTVVPEPSSAALLGLGGLALILRRRK